MGQARTWGLQPHRPGQSYSPLTIRLLPSDTSKAREASRSRTSRGTDPAEREECQQGRHGNLSSPHRRRLLPVLGSMVA